MALVPCPPSGDTDGVGNPVRKYQLTELNSDGEMTFTPDELFYAACENKGICNPEEDFKSKKQRDFIDITGGEFEEELAAQRLSSYDLLRAQKMALVLRERENLLSGSKKQKIDIPSLRPCLSLYSKQTNLEQMVKEREQLFNKRTLQRQRVKGFIEKRNQEEASRKEAAYKEVKLRHLLSAVQRMEIDKVNETLIVDRHRKHETDRVIRNKIQEQWKQNSEQYQSAIENKLKLYDMALVDIETNKSQWLREKIRKRRTREASAQQSRLTSDKERIKTLDVKSQRFTEVADRKTALDTEKIKLLRYRRELQEAYSRQVSSRGTYLDNSRAEEIISFYTAKEAKANVTLAQGSQNAAWKVASTIAKNTQRRRQASQLRCAISAVDSTYQREKYESRSHKMSAASRSRDRSLRLRSESLRLAESRRLEMSKRATREQLLQRQQLLDGIDEKNIKSEQRVAAIKSFQQPHSR